MVESIKELEKEFLEYIKKMQAYEEALGLIYWDLRTGAPKNGAEQRSYVIGVLSAEHFQMSISEEMAAYIASLSGRLNELTELGKQIVVEMQKQYERNKKIPAKEYQEYVVLQANAETIWEEARATSNFAMFQPYLEKLVAFNKKFIDYWGYQGNKYNTLLDMYEPGVTVEIIDQVFSELKQVVVPLIKKIATTVDNNSGADFLTKPFPKEKQAEFSRFVLKQMGYDFNSGRVDETVHPFAIGLNPGDVRITTRYNENDWRLSVFGTIHEGGHALYEQNISKELIGTPLCTGTSMGIHESQSLFYENIVARDQAFWEYNYEQLKNVSNGQFDDVSLEQFYQAINEVKPSLIRIEADELTYSLHIIIRYEIEKALFNNEIEVKDLPKIWNDKYEEYLGIRPTTDAEGILQDVHWAGGSFGYFPSYALGYMYAAQLKNKLIQDIPNYEELLRTGHLLPIKQWLSEHVHQYGKTKKPLEIIEKATGEGLNAKYLNDYLVNKFSSVYKLSE